MSGQLTSVRRVVEETLGLKAVGAFLNERYVHHFVSKRLQDELGTLDLTAGCDGIFLHPEWPTYKAARSIPEPDTIRFGKYRDGMPSRDGKGGFVDFAVGEYLRPAIAIEVTLRHSWGLADVVFDLTKLLDKRNPFSSAVSLNFIVRCHSLAEKRRKERLKAGLDAVVPRAEKRLAGFGCCKDRLCFLAVVEVAASARTYWYFHKQRNVFVECAEPSLRYWSEATPQDVDRRAGTAELRQ